MKPPPTVRSTPLLGSASRTREIGDGDAGGSGFARSRSVRYSSTDSTTQPSGGGAVCVAAIEAMDRQTRAPACTRRARPIRVLLPGFDTESRQAAIAYDAANG